jgi:histidyl-tRNA synthetase
LLTAAPRGTKDILPAEARDWRYVENIIRGICSVYNYQEIRTPIFEHTELFLRGIGEATDVVDKEMYTFLDRGKRSITLRPENTASAVRAFVEHKLYAEPAPVKLFYMGPMFRYDRPQAGRQRQFHQFGVEALGVPGPNIDAEIILLAVHILQKLGLQDLQLKINSVGCPNCRPVYRKKLQEYFRPHLAELCEDCQSRFERNPMRILDCKVPTCKAVAAGAPHLADSLCEECKAHFEGLQKLLTAEGIKYTLDPNLVRGLDYYTKTAFEIQYAALGAQSAVCGGGRYDGLVAEIGGPPTPGIGFAMGLERLLLALQGQQLLPPAANLLDVYAVTCNQARFGETFTAVQQLRHAGFKAEYDYAGRSLKAQMKQANRLQARYVLIFGDEEGLRGHVTLKNMQSSEQKEIALTEIINILETEVQSNG